MFYTLFMSLHHYCILCVISRRKLKYTHIRLWWWLEVPWRQGFRHPTRNKCMGRLTMRNWRDRGSWWGEGKEWCGADLQELFSTRYAMGTVEEICEGWSRNLFDLGWAGPSMKSMVNDRWVSERVDMDLLKWLRRVLLLRHRWITYNGCCIVKKVGWATLFFFFFFLSTIDLQVQLERLQHFTDLQKTSRHTSDLKPPQTRRPRSIWQHISNISWDSFSPFSNSYMLFFLHPALFLLMPGKQMLAIIPRSARWTMYPLTLWF